MRQRLLPLALLLAAGPLAAQVVAVHDLQGPGARSPYEGRTVSTRGIVTARRTNGFFLQAPDTEADADPATSEGVFVFTSSAPPAQAAVGNDLSLTATVAEYVPSSDRGSPPLTELTSPRDYVVRSSGNRLPAPAAITPADTPPGAGLDVLERLEGMRVSVDALVVVGPTGGSVNEAAALATSNGLFFGVVAGVPRPFREAGIAAPDVPPSGSVPPIPRFDANAETLRVDSDALPGTSPLDVATGAVVTGLVGPLDYGGRCYTILPEPGAQVAVAGGLRARAVSTPLPEEITVGSFNLERFFDAADDPAIGEPVLSADAFGRRLAKASAALRDVLRAPDVLGVVEVESLAALRALAQRISTDALAAGQPDPRYEAFLEEGNDASGIDVGFLVKTAPGPSGAPRVQVVATAQVGKDELFPPDGTKLNDRPALLLDAEVATADGPFRLTTVVCHLRSLSGIDDPSTGERTRQKRRAQAESLARLVRDLQSADPSRRIALVGDFNAFEVSDGYVDVVGTIRGAPAPAGEVVLPSADLYDPDLVDLVAHVPPPERSTFVFGGTAQVLDHVLVNEALLAAAASVRLEVARLGADFPETARNDATRPERLSDHDAVLAFLVPVGASGAASATRVVPVVVDVTGSGDARFSSELVLANRGATTARATLAYAAASALRASGSGAVVETLGPGTQLSFGDVVAHLRARGLPIPEGSQGGSLTVRFTGLSSPGAAHASARTTAPSGKGRAGLSYRGVPASSLEAPVVGLFGLRHDAADRTNLALVNAGTEGPVTLRVSLASGLAGSEIPNASLPDLTLGPGEWWQLNAVLAPYALAGNAVARVERVAGSSPFLAYAVVNDNGTNDGSFVEAVPIPAEAGSRLLPVLVETATYRSELVLANPTSETVRVTLAYRESLAGEEQAEPVVETLLPGAQLLVPEALRWLRGKGGAGPEGPDRAGSLTATFETASGAPAPGVAGARTSAPAPGSGAYGLFSSAVRTDRLASSQAFVHGLRSDGSTRSNLALVAGPAPVTLRVDVFDGGTGVRAASLGPFSLGPWGWTQLNGVLDGTGVASGYVRVVRASEAGVFLAYGTVVDGADRESGTNDGSYVEMEVPELSFRPAAPDTR